MHPNVRANDMIFIITMQCNVIFPKILDVPPSSSQVLSFFAPHYDKHFNDFLMTIFEHFTIRH